MSPSTKGSCGRHSESYNVFFESRHVGRIYKAVSHAPREAPWFRGLEFHEWQGSDRPQYANVASLEAAKQAFRAWDRRPNDFLGQALALMFLIDWPEPFGLSMIEAMACGTPVLALRHGSVEEVVEDG